MSHVWDDTGLSDFRSWLGETRKREGLVYRGDADFEQLGPGAQVTLIEFKMYGEKLGRGQLAWLRVRARQPRTEVRVVRETSDNPDVRDPSRLVRVWNPKENVDHVVPLSEVAAWVDSRAYRA